MTSFQPLFIGLSRRGSSPLVVAHRGDSRRHPENTLAALEAAAAEATPAVEFDVRQLRCGTLVCMHDATCDRTTDAARRLGPGALVAQLDLPTVRELVARGHAAGSAGSHGVPTLAEALRVLLPRSVPMIEHKAGEPRAYVDELRRAGAAETCILQSFDWDWIAAVRRLAPEIALGVLGPTSRHSQLDANAIRAAGDLGVGMLHWQVDAWTSAAVRAAGAIGLWTCGYTADDELRRRGAAAIGLHALCTNDPAAALASA